MTAVADELIWDPRDLDQIHDPYPAYRRLRTEAPLWRHPVAWVLSQYGDVERALRDRRLLNHGLNHEMLHEKLFAGVTPPLGDVTRTHQRPWLLFQSGEHHTLMRKLLNKGFSASSLERARPAVHQVVDHLIAQVRDEERFDFIEKFAVALPMTMICELFGVPEEYRSSLRGLLSPLGKTMTAVPLDDATAAQVDDAVRAFEQTMQLLIAERRRHPGDDMISLLLDDTNGPVDDREVISNLGVLLFAGHETTVGLLANGMLALLRNPEQQQALRADPSLTDNAVEEMLRYDAPAQRVARVAHEPLEIRGTAIARGEMIWLMIGSANRDEEVWPDAARFDVARPSPKPLSFGKGAHFCIGAPLARLEGQVAFPALLAALDGFGLAADAVSYNPTATLRAPSRMWLSR